MVDEPSEQELKILHVDMDAFYASVEERDRNDLGGKPLVVGGSAASRGVVAAANYRAREYGVHSAMPTATALRICPEAVVLPPRIKVYAEVSRQIQAILHRFTPLVEPLSLDEAFLDVGGTVSLFGSAASIGWKIKQAIRDELQLVASVGVAGNKYLAKLASDLDKPDGFLTVPSNGVQEFLDPLPVERIWGVGRATGSIFQDLGVQTIGQLRALTRLTLDRRLGRSGEQIWNLARGIDFRRVIPDSEAKSISHETTFSRDVDDPEVLRSWLVSLVEQVGRRLRKQKLRGRTVHLKIRYDDFDTITRSQSLSEATDITETLWRVAANLLKTRLPDRKLCVRLIGMGVSRFERSGMRQQQMFGEEKAVNEALDAVTDQIADRFGGDAIHRANVSGRRSADDRHSGSDPS